MWQMVIQKDLQTFVRNFRKSYPNVVIIAGNVVTADQTQELLLNGADIIKVGIGSVQYVQQEYKPVLDIQLSVLYECADVPSRWSYYCPRWL